LQFYVIKQQSLRKQPKIKNNDIEHIEIINIIVAECLQSLEIEYEIKEKDDLINGLMRIKSEIMNRSHSKNELIYGRLLDVNILVDHTVLTNE
jgi:hypothetical protein